MGCKEKEGMEDKSNELVTCRKAHAFYSQIAHTPSLSYREILVVQWYVVGSSTVLFHGE